MITQAIYDKLATDATLAGQLATYRSAPAIFTTDPAPEDATLPYIVTAGEVATTPLDTKTTRGRTLLRDVRCYTAKSGSANLVESIAERVRTLLHRQPLTIAGYTWHISDCTGPVAADELDVYGRVITLSLTAQEA